MVAVVVVIVVVVVVILLRAMIYRGRRGANSACKC